MKKKTLNRAMAMARATHILKVAALGSAGTMVPVVHPKKMKTQVETKW